MSILIAVLIEIYNCSARLLRHLIQRSRERIVRIDPIAIYDCVCPNCSSAVVFDIKIGKSPLCRVCQARGCLCGEC